MTPKFTQGENIKFGFGKNPRRKGIVSKSLYYEWPDRTSGFTYHIKSDSDGEIYSVLENNIIKNN